MSRVSRRDLAQAVLNMLDSGKSVDLVIRQVADYLVTERRSNDLESLMREVQSLRNAKHGILEAEAASAHELTPAIKREITSLLGAKHVILDIVHEPELVGGVRVRSLDQQLDLSVESKLKQLKHTVN